jgi:hypothetical protein
VRAHLGGRTTPYETMLKGLKVPVLVTNGNQDKAVLKAASLYTAATVPGAKTSYYEGIGHAPFWEDTPRFNKELAIRSGVRHRRVGRRRSRNRRRPTRDRLRRMRYPPADTGGRAESSGRGGRVPPRRFRQT